MALYSLETEWLMGPNFIRQVRDPCVSTHRRKPLNRQYLSFCNEMHCR